MASEIYFFLMGEDIFRDTINKRPVRFANEAAMKLIIITGALDIITLLEKRGMLISKNGLFRTAAVLLWLITSPYAMSAATCKLSNVSQEITATLPIVPANITAGPDLPDGTILYTGYFSPATNPEITCTIGSVGAFSFSKYLKVLSASTSLTGWTNSKFSHVYESGVGGVGIVIWKGSYGITPTPYIVEKYSFNGSTSIVAGMNSSFNYGLIKTGNITPGTVNGANFPTIVSAVTNDYGVSNLPPDITVAKINFSGAINIVSKTCTTPDINVPMGSYNVADYFHQVGSYTPWKDASITLTDCPRFYGYYGTNNEVTVSNTGGQRIPTATANSLFITVQPNTTIIDAANGIMAVSSSNNNQAATGIGIQMGWGEASGTPTALNFNGMTYPLVNNGVSSIAIPLAARYIQTATVVTPGRADGKATFMINYY